MEPYPRGMGALRAIKLGGGALLGPKELTVQQIQQCIASRYPQAEPVPGRPALDNLRAKPALPGCGTTPGDSGKGVYRPPYRAPDARPRTSTHFVLRDDWQSHFLRKQAEEGKSLRQWLDVFGIEAHSAPHMQTVQVTLALLSGLIEAKKDAVPQALTTATIATSAAALQGFVRGKVTLDQLEEQLDHVVCHQEATQQEARLERVRMALRLLDWPGPPRSCSWSWMR